MINLKKFRENSNPDLVLHEPNGVYYEMKRTNRLKKMEPFKWQKYTRAMMFVQIFTFSLFLTGWQLDDNQSDGDILTGRTTREHGL